MISKSILDLQSAKIHLTAVSHKSRTLPFAHRRNIACLGLNPTGNLLLSVDDDGKAILSSLPLGLALYHLSFQASTSCVSFSPSGRHLAAAVGRVVEIWQLADPTTDAVNQGVTFAPFTRYRAFTGHDDRVQQVTWSGDGRFLLSCSRDLTAHLWSLDLASGVSPTSLSGHRDALVGAWFSANQENVFRPCYSSATN